MSLVYTAISTSCGSGIQAFTSWIALIGLVGTLVFLALVIGYLLNMIDKTKLN
jgi:hypothetical protein